MKKNRKHYLKIVEWSAEDGCYIGRCPELFLGGVHGQEEAKVYAELCTAVAEVVALIESKGDQLPPRWRRRTSAENSSCVSIPTCTACSRRGP